MTALAPVPERCAKCLVPMRKSHQPIADNPGTRVHAGSGLCYTCWRKDREARQAAEAAAAGNREALQGYLRRRGRVHA